MFCGDGFDSRCGLTRAYETNEPVKTQNEVGSIPARRAAF
jgi:hypothetical protein